MASDEETRKMIQEIAKVQRQITNLKAKVRRRRRKLGNAFTLLERQRIEYEIELLRGEIRRFEIVEMQLSIPLIRGLANPSEMELEDKVDWTKAGKA